MRDDPRVAALGFVRPPKRQSDIVLECKDVERGDGSALFLLNELPVTVLVFLA